MIMGDDDEGGWVQIGIHVCDSCRYVRAMLVANIYHRPSQQSDGLIPVDDDDDDDSDEQRCRELINRDASRPVPFVASVQRNLS